MLSTAHQTISTTTNIQSTSGSAALGIDAIKSEQFEIIKSALTNLNTTLKSKPNRNQVKKALTEKLKKIPKDVLQSARVICADHLIVVASRYFEKENVKTADKRNVEACLSVLMQITELI
jgi:lipoate-protein ligase A